MQHAIFLFHTISPLPSKTGLSMRQSRSVVQHRFSGPCSHAKLSLKRLVRSNFRQKHKSYAQVSLQKRVKCLASPRSGLCVTILFWIRRFLRTSRLWCKASQTKHSLRSQVLNTVHPTPCKLLTLERHNLRTSQTF